VEVETGVRRVLQDLLPQGYAAAFAFAGNAPWIRRPLNDRTQDWKEATQMRSCDPRRQQGLPGLPSEPIRRIVSEHSG